MLKSMKPILSSFLAAVLSICFFASCNKEQKLADHLAGKWTIDKVALSDTTTLDFGNFRHSIQFEPCEKAYTSTCRGYYIIDSADVVSYTDSILFDLRKEEITISFVQNQAKIGFLKNRFSLSDPESTTLILTQEGVAPDAKNRIGLTLTKQ
jgi:hypothetical protein